MKKKLNNELQFNNKKMKQNRTLKNKELDEEKTVYLIE